MPLLTNSFLSTHPPHLLPLFLSCKRGRGIYPFAFQLSGITAANVLSYASARCLLGIVLIKPFPSTMKGLAYSGLESYHDRPYDKTCPLHLQKAGRWDFKTKKMPPLFCYLFTCLTGLCQDFTWCVRLCDAVFSIICLTWVLEKEQEVMQAAMMDEKNCFVSRTSLKNTLAICRTYRICWILKSYAASVHSPLIPLEYSTRWGDELMVENVLIKHKPNNG